MQRPPRFHRSRASSQETSVYTWKIYLARLGRPHSKTESVRGVADVQLGAEVPPGSREMSGSASYTC